MIRCLNCVFVLLFSGFASAAADDHMIVNSIGMKLALVPAGEFMMGSPKGEVGRHSDEGPVHRVRITRSFFIGAYEVTQAEYEQVIGVNPSFFKTMPGEDTRRFPVEQVSWNDAQEFCRRLSDLPGEKATGRAYRLPTEAEWEYACRAGTTTPFHCGTNLNGDQTHCRVPWDPATRGPYLERTISVGRYPPNTFGLYDMHGNVFE